MGVRRLLLVAVAFIAFSGSAIAADTSSLLYRYRPPDVEPPPNVELFTFWNDGHFGPIFAFQAALRARLAAAGVPESDLAGIGPDGNYGHDTQAGIERLLTLPTFADLAPAPGRVAGITTALWQRLLPNMPSPPDVEQRIETFILTYEATPYDRNAEWNFCQSGGKDVDRRTADPCLTNDPTSYLTWGPHGATAGGGREIQAVLIAADRTDPRLIDNAFGAEAPSVRRLLHLEERRTAPAILDTERYLCGIWLDPPRADRWAQGLATFGTRAEVRAIYSDLYHSGDYDAEKVAAFRRLYQALGHQPTEIDLAFFLDRATQTNGVFAHNMGPDSPEAVNDVAARVRAILPNPAAAAPWRIRRALSNILATSNQGPERNGRDVVFFVDAVGEAGLNVDERANWLEGGPRYASDLGLSDERPAPLLPVSTTDYPRLAQPTDTLSAAEAAQCPIRVLNWTNPDNHGTRDPQIR